MEKLSYIQARDVSLFLNSIGQNCIYLYSESVLFAFTSFEILTTDRGDSYGIRIVGKDVSDIYSFLAQKAQTSTNDTEQSIQKYEVAQKIDLLPISVREHSMISYVKFLTH